jgi:acetylornithine deacetylase
MGRVLGRLEALERELSQRSPHPLLGAPSLHASLVEGGRELSTYPNRCVLRLERRTLPGEAAGCALEEVRGILEALSAEDPAFRGSARRLFAQPAYETPEGHPIVEALEASLTATGRASRRGGMSYWTDAAILGVAGIPSVIFGPGGAGLHGLEEYVLLDQVTGCRDALIETIRRFCGRRSG